MFMMFAAPPEQSLEWNDSGVEGAHRFLKRLWAFCHDKADVIQQNAEFDSDSSSDEVKNARRDIHAQLKQALHDFDKYQFNTVIAACMKMLNVLNELQSADQDNTRDGVISEGVSIVLRLLSPVAPHITHTLWQALGYGDDILNSDWPVVDESALVQDSIELVVQVNGKLRAKVQVPADASKDEIEKIALASDNVQTHTEGKTVRKVIVVPGRLVNIVVG